MQKNIMASEAAQMIMNPTRKTKAVELYAKKKVSLGVASRLAGVTLSEFIDLLAQHNTSLNLEKGDVAQALAAAREAL